MVYGITRKRLVTLLVLAATVFIPARAMASSILISDFGPGDTYQNSTGTGWAVGAGAPLANNSDAVSYLNSTAITYRLDQFRFADNWFNGTNSLDVGFWVGADLNSAALLDSFTFSASAFRTPQIFTAVPHLPILLLPGNTYWIVQSVADALTNGTDWGWQWNDQGVNGYYARFGTWFPEAGVRPVFDVSGTDNALASPVPEPATLTLLGMGLAGWAARRRRNA